MDKDCLDTILKKFFFNDWNRDVNYYLRDLISLVAFYGDEDLTAELKDSLNQVTAALVKIGLIEDIIRSFRDGIPTRYSCELDTRGGKEPSNFTFSPVITLTDSNLKELANLKNDIETVYNEMKNIDIAGLVLYVKTKASAAGHLSLDT